MDPLSVTVAVFALIAAASKAAIAVKKASFTIKNASAQRDEVLRELQLFQNVLERFCESAAGKDDIDDDETGSIETGDDDNDSNSGHESRADQSIVQPPIRPGNRSNNSPLIDALLQPGGLKDKCLKELSAIQHICQKTNSSLRWQQKYGKINERLIEIAKHRTELVTLMEMRVVEIQLSIRDQLSSIGAHLEDSVIADVLHWLSPTDPRLQFFANFAKFEAEDIGTDRAHTGQWFLESSAFQQWEQDGGLLWLHGIAGSGKTVLATKAVNHLFGSARSQSDMVVLFFYFDFKDKSGGVMAASLLRSLIAQLLWHNDSAVLPIVNKLYRACAKTRQPATSEMMSVVRQCLEQFSRVTLVIDALDECTDVNELEQVLHGIAHPHLSMLLTSRKEASLEEFLAEDASFETQVDATSVNQDVEIYLHRRVYYAGGRERCRTWSKELRENVIDTLAKRADGMFRLAEIQFELLLKCTDSADVVETLELLPNSFFEVYDRVLLSLIRENNTVWRTSRIIAALLCSYQKLSLEDINVLLRLRPNETVKLIKSEFEYPDSTDGIRQRWLTYKQMCGELIALSESTVQFSHQTVYEYITSDHLQRHSDMTLQQFSMKRETCHRIMAELCFACLLSFDSYDDFGLAQLQENPFALYAAKYGFSHAMNANNEEHRGCLDDLLLDFLGKSPQSYANFCRLHSTYNHSRGVKWDIFESVEKAIRLEVAPRRPWVSSPMIQACAHNLYRVVEHLIRLGHDVNDGLVSYRRKYNVVIDSLVNRSMETFTILINNGAELNNLDTGVSILQQALDVDDPTFAKKLLEHGADPNLSGSRWGTALQYPADSIEAFIAVLEYGADPNQVNEIKDSVWVFPVATPLQAHALGNFFEHMDQLIRYGANVNQIAGEMGTALHAAAAKSDGHDSVKFLLEHDADPNIVAGKFGSVLNAAGYAGNQSSLHLLLDHGARLEACIQDGRRWQDINEVERSSLLTEIIEKAQDRFEGSLPEAVRSGSLDAVQKALIRGADRFKCISNGMSPLSLAVAENFTEIVCKLLEKDPEDQLEMVNDFGSTPLIYAAVRGNLQMVRILVEAGANQEAEDIFGRTAAYVAREYGEGEIVEYLESLSVERGETVNENIG